MAKRVERDVRRVLETEYHIVATNADVVHGVINGLVTRDRTHRYLLQLQLVEPDTGKRIMQLKFRLDKPRLRASMRRRLLRRLRLSIRSLVPSVQQQEGDRPEDISLSQRRATESGVEPAVKRTGESVPGGLASIPIELTAGFERTVMNVSHRPGTSYVFIRGDVYPWMARRGLLNRLGVVVEIYRCVDSADDGQTTEILIGATTYYEYEHGVFLAIAEADAGIGTVVSRAADTEIRPLFSALLAAGVRFGPFLLLGQVAGLTITGKTELDEVFLVPGVIVDWRLRPGGIHPFAVASLPLGNAVYRADTPPNVMIGIRYEQ
ncbi:MAG: hypothetical protein MJE77_03395 [Proteobacteria bacterium]|nr:hypothetical protein [Pseudomonadota bacterium]